MTMMRILKVAGGVNAHILLAIRIKWTDLNSLMQIDEIFGDFGIIKAVQYRTISEYGLNMLKR